MEDFEQHMCELRDENQGTGAGRPSNTLNVICLKNLFIFDVFNIFIMELFLKVFESIRGNYIKCWAG